MKKGKMTKADVEGLKSLYDILSQFHQDIKASAQKADKKNALVVRRYFEKHLSRTSADLSAIDARIRRAEMTLFRKETRALMDADEAEDDVQA